MIPVPFYHCFGMVMANLGCTSHGATMIIPAPGFDPEITLRCIADERATGVYGVPTMFIAMQNHATFPEHDLSTLRTGIMAGSICPVEVMKRCVDDMHMAEVSIAYGMTETSPVSCQTRADDDLERRTATIGRVHPHVEIKVVDPVTGEVLPRGETGEFCTRGYSVMVGYWEDDEKTAEAIDADGWMHTGDLAEMREDGYCTIVGRIKDMVIRGGENIYPREIEEFLYQHPDIEDVQVVGVPDEKYGEELCAWLKMKADATPLDADAVRAFATGRLAHYKIPRYVMVVEEFPMTVTGKIRKVQMREESAAASSASPDPKCSVVEQRAPASVVETPSAPASARDLHRNAGDGAGRAAPDHAAVVGASGGVAHRDEERRRLTRPEPDRRGRHRDVPPEAHGAGGEVARAPEDVGDRPPHPSLSVGEQDRRGVQPVLPARQPGAVVVAVELVDQARANGGVGPEPAGARVQHVARQGSRRGAQRRPHRGGRPVRAREQRGRRARGVRRRGGGPGDEVPALRAGDRAEHAGGRSHQVGLEHPDEGAAGARPARDRPGLADHADRPQRDSRTRGAGPPSGAAPGPGRRRGAPSARCGSRR